MTDNQTDAGELEPCPFCGGAVHAETLPGVKDYPWGIHCPDGRCPLSGGFPVVAATEAEAITAWNTRHPTAGHREAVAAEREACAKAIHGRSVIKHVEWAALPPKAREAFLLQADEWLEIAAAIRTRQPSTPVPDDGERLRKQLGLALEALEAIIDGDADVSGIAQQTLDDITRVGIEAIALTKEDRNVTGG